MSMYNTQEMKGLKKAAQHFHRHGIINTPEGIFGPCRRKR
jgi:hypothetical protein